MKKFLILLCVLISLSSYAQITTNSVLSATNYILDPAKYLSNITSQSLPTNVLLDKTFFDDEIFNFNGLDRVKNCNFKTWKSLYTTIKKSYVGDEEKLFYNMDSLNAFRQINEQNFLTPIMILNFDCSYISKQALEDGDLIEEDDYLKENKTTSTTYDKSTVVASSLLNNYIYGDDINFIVYKDFYFTNKKCEPQIFIDFDNGEDFVPVNFDEIYTINYSSQSEDVLMKLKLVTEQDTLYSHCIFYRKGTSTIPLPDVIGQKDNLLKSHPVKLPEDRLFYYPEGELVEFNRFLYKRIGSDIEYCFYFNPSNKTGFLQKPLVFCDGFDPQNTKNYYYNTGDFDPKGMYETLNGDPSKNEKDVNRPSANLISKLQSLGYDIVFVNFLDGAGDIVYNAEALRGFLNNVINEKFRNEDTEEILMIGPSMGAVVTRYTLAKMDELHEEHYVKQWISFDGPHKGANVSPGFQWLVKYFSHLHLLDMLGLLDEFQESLKMLEEPAAKQMLLQSILTMEDEETICDKKLYQKGKNGTIEPHLDFRSFYTNMEKLNNGEGYPSVVKRYAISNGGKNQRFDEGVEIAKFKLFSWTYASAYAQNNKDGEYKIFDGHKQDNPFDGDGRNDNDYKLYTAKQIGYDNAPGGGYAMNKILNQNEHNKYDVSTNEPQYTSFTFMPTPTVLGIPITRENVYTSWDKFDRNETPFDEWFGMKENEEHIQITENTAQCIIIDSIINSDYQNFTYPYDRGEKAVAKTVSKDVLYRGKIINFAGGKNTFEIKNNATVNVVADSNIVFKKGFKVNKGSYLHALVNNNTLKNEKTFPDMSRESIRYEKTLTHKNDVYDYSTKKELLCEKPSFNVYPNPLASYVYIDMGNQSFDNFEYIIYSSTGEIINVGNVSTVNGIIDFSCMKSGMYILVLKKQDAIVYTKKLIKQ